VRTRTAAEASLEPYNPDPADPAVRVVLLMVVLSRDSSSSAPDSARSHRCMIASSTSRPSARRIARTQWSTEGLSLMIDRGSSHGADAVANPAYDLREHQDLDAQVDDWVAQIGLDAGLLGMERLLEQPHLPPGLR
jgi:hypothetical protein